MYPGLSDDLSQVDDSRKITIINCELKQLNIDIAALEENKTTRSFGKGWLTMTLGPAASATLVSAG